MPEADPSTPTAIATEPPHRHLVLIVVVVLIVALPFGFYLFQRDTEPAPPGAFYRPPDPLPGGPAGTIIRSETVDSSSADVRLWRVLYTSTDPSDTPIAVSGMVGAPVGTPPAGGWPVVAWAHGTSGVATQCAPSLMHEVGIARIPEFAELIAAGNVVVATDYPGLGTPGPHPYLVGESEGRAALDSIRSAGALLPGEISPVSAVYGHSQGGHAVVFTAIVAPTYAPELKLVGAAAMAPPTDLGLLLERDATEPAGILLTALAVQSWSELYPEAPLDAVVHGEAKPFVKHLAGRCVDTDEEGLSDVPDIIALRLRFLSADPATTPGWSSLLDTNSPGPAALTVPMLVAQGLTDTLVRPDVTMDYVKEQCAAGASIELYTYANVGHFGVRTVAAPDVLAWLEARVGGTPATPGCTTQAK